MAALSTGPRTPEGKARVVAAMVEGRRKWVERRRAEGKKFPAGRKRGERWVTEPMRELARAEAHRLKGGRFTLDRALTLALLRSANGCLESKARAKAMLDAQELMRRWSGIVRRGLHVFPNYVRRYSPTHRRARTSLRLGGPMLVWLTKISATRRLRPLVMPRIFEPVSKDAESAPNLLGELVASFNQFERI